MKILIALALLAPTDSAVRKPNEHWEQPARRHFRTATDAKDPRTAHGAAKPYDSITNISALPEWTHDVSELIPPFVHARDVRMYGSRKFLRRSTWLYPNDGCFARAAHVTRAVAAGGAPLRPGKVFIFGNLTLPTRYNRAGRVHWWFHVAAAYRKGDTVLILDPAIEPYRPLPLAEWVAKFSRTPGSTRVSLCDANSYYPRHRCIGGSRAQERSAISTQTGFLNPEWNRVLSLGLSPRKVLGDEPPWAQRTLGGD
jgi:hypothetical protein